MKSEFEKQRSKYNRLGENIKDALIQFLQNEHIDFSGVEYRIKTFKSFSKKIERKNYENPLDDITDICGIRIINYYPSDLDKITTIVNNEFDVIESLNKQNEMDDDRFGYRSYHYVATIKKGWLAAPNYRGLDGLKFEIQARTILMHGWAAISHKLAYKNESDVPKQFRRDLFRLSALIELADEQFERLRNERSEYSGSFLGTGASGLQEFIPKDDLNTDSLQALLDYYFPDRKSGHVSSLLGELNDLDMNLVDFESAIKSVSPILIEIENDENSVIDDSNINWAQEGAARTVLDLTNDKYFSRHKNTAIPQEMLEILSYWRDKLKVSKETDNE